MPLRVSEGDGHAVGEERAVRQSGDGVVIREVLELRAALLEQAYVAPIEKKEEKCERDWPADGDAEVDQSSTPITRTRKSPKAGAV
jgi:hypothetical protein